MEQNAYLKPLSSELANLMVIADNIATNRASRIERIDEAIRLLTKEKEYVVEPYDQQAEETNDEIADVKKRLIDVWEKEDLYPPTMTFGAGTLRFRKSTKEYMTVSLERTSNE